MQRFTQFTLSEMVDKDDTEDQSIKKADHATLQLKHRHMQSSWSDDKGSHHTLSHNSHDEVSKPKIDFHHFVGGKHKASFSVPIDKTQSREDIGKAVPKGTHASVADKIHQRHAADHSSYNHYNS